MKKILHLFVFLLLIAPILLLAFIFLPQDSGQLAGRFELNENEEIKSDVISKFLSQKQATEISRSTRDRLIIFTNPNHPEFRKLKSDLDKIKAQFPSNSPHILAIYEPYYVFDRDRILSNDLNADFVLTKNISRKELGLKTNSDWALTNQYGKILLEGEIQKRDEIFKKYKQMIVPKGKSSSPNIMQKTNKQSFFQLKIADKDEDLKPNTISLKGNWEVKDTYFYPKQIDETTFIELEIENIEELTFIAEPKAISAVKLKVISYTENPDFAYHQVFFDKQKNAWISVYEPRIYVLIENSKHEKNRLKIFPQASEVNFYGFYGKAFF
jgi:hypothetical protein